jgi:hypothetical protein
VSFCPKQDHVVVTLIVAVIAAITALTVITRVLAQAVTSLTQ